MLTEPGRAVTVRIPLEQGRAYVEDETRPAAPQWLHYDEELIGPETDDAVHRHVLQYSFVHPWTAYTGIIGLLEPAAATSDIELMVCARRADRAPCDARTRQSVAGPQGATFVSGTGLGKPWAFQGRDTPVTAFVEAGYRRSLGATLRFAVLQIQGVYPR